MSAEQKQKLEQQLWKIADILRGNMDSYIYSGQKPIRDDVFKCLNNCPSKLKAREISERILHKMKEFVNVFVVGKVG